jgi:hypothetical protein
VELNANTFAASSGFTGRVLLVSLGAYVGDSPVEALRDLSPLAMKEVSEIMDSSRELSRTLPRDLLNNKNAHEIMRPAENVHTV